MSEFRIGDKVKFLSQDDHDESPRWYPPVGTIGTVLEDGESDKDLLVDWGDAKGVDSDDNGKKAWWVFKKNVEKLPMVETPRVTDAETYTNDEVWEMLKPKMRHFALPYSDIDNFPQEIKNMIIAAYRSGYGRAIKGRSFMIPERERKDKKRNCNSLYNALIYNALRGCTLVNVWEDTGSFLVSHFLRLEEGARYGKKDVKIYGRYVYNDDDTFFEGNEGFDWLSDLSVYVAVSLKGGLKIGDFKHVLLKNPTPSNGEAPYSIGDFISEKDNMVTINDHSVCGRFCANVNNMWISALVPLHAYLKYKDVNV